MSDPNFDKRVSLLHFEGGDATTVFTDVLGKTWTPVGNAQIDTAQFKWGSAAGLFDGTGDYISTPDHADFDFGAGDFTLEGFLRTTTVAAGNRCILSKQSAAGYGIIIQQEAAALKFYASSVGAAWDIASAAVMKTTLTANTWYHYAISRNGTQITGYIDGVLGPGFPLTVGAATPVLATTTALRYGADGAGISGWNGWLDDQRISKGRGEYPSAFTPPAAAFEDSAGDPYWSNVVSLLHCEGADAATTFTDVKGKVWTANGNAQIDTAQFKYGAASGLFDGVTDWISTPSHADFDFGTGDFTVEGWIRPSTITGNGRVIGKLPTNAAIGWIVVQRQTNSFVFYASSNGTAWDIAVGKVIGTVAADTWYHWAVSREGNTWHAFLGGVEGSGFPFTSALAPFLGTTKVTIGATDNGETCWAGHLDDIRITKGVARYTANFTPPTASFEDFASESATGDAAFTLPMLLLNWVDAIAQFDLPVLTLDAAGVGGVVGRADAIALPMLGLDANTVIGGAGAASFALPMLGVSALGGDSTDIVLPVLTLQAQGLTGELGRAAFSLPMLGMDARGFASVIGNADFALPMLALDAKSLVGVVGAADFSLPALGLSASSTGGIVGNASIVLPMLTLAAKGWGPAVGTAEFTLPMIWLSGLGRTAVSANFRAWAINMRNKALSEYKDLVFNSFATFEGKVYAASATGIYELGTQATDAGVAISATMRTGKNDYASSFLKRIPRLYVNGDFSGDMTFKAITVEQGSYTYPLASHGAGLRACRVVLGKGLKSRQYQFEIANVAGAAFSINSIAAYPIKIGRRVSSA